MIGNGLINRYSTKEMEVFIKKSFAHLREMKEQNNRDRFNQLMEEIMPSVRIYLNRLLTSAIHSGQLPQGKFKVDDFADELFVVAFDRFNELEDQNDFHTWVFKLTDKVWDDIVTEEEFDNFFFQNIDNYTQVEWEAMEESFSIDGDGDLVPDDEADEPAFQHYAYALNDVFVEDDEVSFIEKVNQEVKRDQIMRHIDLILKKLPVSLKSVFELSRKLGFELEQIAKIKGIAPEEVQKNISSVEQYVKTSFENRFNI